jgi:hypothetical protein
MYVLSSDDGVSRAKSGGLRRWHDGNGIVDLMFEAWRPEREKVCDDDLGWAF